MTITNNKLAIHRLVDAVNTGKLDALDELTIADLIIHGDTLLPLGRGRELGKNLIVAFWAAFPDAQFTIEQLFTEQDKVVSRIAVSGTHKGQWLGSAPTGKEITWTVSAVTRFHDGKLVELWGIADELGLMQQIGLAPSRGG